MKHRILSRRLLLLSSILVAALVSGREALAQSGPPVEPGPGLERTEGIWSTAALPFSFEGVVLDPHGVPAEGAVVVSSAGGQAVTDVSGSFRLETQVPFEAQSVQVTAVGRAGGNLLASRQVLLHATSGYSWVGDLQLAQESSCTPSWLPTFGGMPGTNDEVSALTVFDDGGGEALYAGGYFSHAGGVAANRIAKWDGASWAPLGSGMDNRVRALTVFDDGGGAALYAGGGFGTAGGVAANKIAKWDGSSWAALGSGMSGVNQSGVHALTVFDDGGGKALYAAGGFPAAGGVAVNHIAKWDGARWSPLGRGMNNGVSALTVFDDGGGEALYAAGSFGTAGGVAANRIAKWDGSSWAPLGSGMDSYVSALTVFDDGGGEALYAGGWIGGPPPDPPGGGSGEAPYGVSYIEKWDGSSWAPLGRGLDGGLPVVGLVFYGVSALTVFDDGGGEALYAGGWFGTAGGLVANRMAKWDGASWAPLDSGMDRGVHALTVFDDGGGDALYAGGDFSTAGGVTAKHIAKWDGASWAPLGSGMDRGVHALTVFDDGGGAALYAGGWFGTAGGVVANRIAKWDGSRWEPLGSGMYDGNSPPVVHALTVFDDGGGEALYAGGEFTTAGGVVANRIAKWDGSSWAPLGSGLEAGVSALTVFDDGGGAALYVGGGFSSAIDSGDSYLAKWGCSDTTPHLGTVYCDPAVPNSTGKPGIMTVSGSAVVADDDLILSATNLPQNSNIGYFIMGRGMNTFTPPGSAGPICVTRGLLRLLPPVSNTNEEPGGFSRSVGTSGPQTGNITPGSTWNFQAWHCDSIAGTWNLTNAVSIDFR